MKTRKESLGIDRKQASQAREGGETPPFFRLTNHIAGVLVAVGTEVADRGHPAVRPTRRSPAYPAAPILEKHHVLNKMANMKFHWLIFQHFYGYFRLGVI